MNFYSKKRGEMNAKDSDLATMMMRQYAYSFEMFGTISANEDKNGRSITMTKIVDGNTVIVDEIKFKDSQTQFASIEIVADEKSGFIKFNMILPCNTSNDLEFNILKRINTFNNKCNEAKVFYSTEKLRYEFNSSIGFASYSDVDTEDPIEANTFRDCRDQACLNCMLGSLGVAESWLGFISNE